ncbi:YnfA family protein [Methanosarcina acetivorans]|uniref:UPF0060 membrane protein MA_3936 n=1 Tax=Methanosarcina acetivorans (strain ATCC 35395 / DSM 2834 / JCM 12185 / C2A) TaxID=188937 RepID=Y3936_METAC|nr:RecName: Full=UPF0060 membrane protein MA_3936 [Methanosarcina acetivorans C2A]AAM07287.1 conserved hypothetical protein [Methanosarcina acetivorans C2A]
MIELGVSLCPFFLAALFEIRGGYLICLWLRNNMRAVFGPLGRLMLAVCGIIPTFQPSHFGRVYAAHGGIFIVFSLIWDLFVDKKIPDRYDHRGNNNVCGCFHYVLRLSLIGRYSVISFCNFQTPRQRISDFFLSRSIKHNFYLFFCNQTLGNYFV